MAKKMIDHPECAGCNAPVDVGCDPEHFSCITKKSKAKKKLIDATYKIMHGCHDCARAFKQYEYDDVDKYFCNRIKTGRRPACGSVCMQEYKYADGKGFYTSRLYALWEKWSKPRAVSAHGWCKYWKDRML